MNTLKNKVILIGRLGKDPEIRQLNDQTKLARFSLATSEKYLDRSGHAQKDTQWHHVVAWNGIATLVENYVHKGQEIAVEGRLRYRQYQGRDGIKKTATEIVVHELMMLRSPKTAYLPLSQVQEPDSEDLKRYLEELEFEDSLLSEEDE
ncbi:single-stranded DNA-binding protein [bacterium SCSIO 12741]|nr:single-stranded DNA-binding protein [bacterium SCSIO 12741]